MRNILVVWGLTGLWHGADWNFLLWGLYYGVLLLLEKLWLGKYLERLPKALRWLLCMIIVCIGWVMFDLTDFAQMRAQNLLRSAPRSRGCSASRTWRCRSRSRRM